MNNDTTLLRDLVSLGSMIGVSLPLTETSFQLLENTGVLRHMTGRVFDEKGALEVVKDNAGLVDTTFLRGQKHLYLRADVQGRLGASRVCRGIFERLDRADPELASAARAAFKLEGPEGMTRTIKSRADQLDLMSRAGVEETKQPSKSYGRAM